MPSNGREIYSVIVKDKKVLAGETLDSDEAAQQRVMLRIGNIKQETLPFLPL